jgi:hypothetical protein
MTGPEPVVLPITPPPNGQAHASGPAGALGGFGSCLAAWLAAASAWLAAASVLPLSTL